MISTPAEYILTSGAARILGLSSATVQWLERTGKLPAIRIDRGVRLFRRVDVECYAREREQRIAIMAGANSARDVA